MYENGVVLSASSTVAGVAVLPNTAGQSVLQYTAIAAITIGVVALVLQLAVAVYRRGQKSADKNVKPPKKDLPPLDFLKQRCGNGDPFSIFEAPL